MIEPERKHRTTLPEIRNLADILDLFDTHPGRRVPEAIPTQILWWALAYFKSLRPYFDLEPEATYEWWLGRQGAGDLTVKSVLGAETGAASKKHSRILRHIEVKSETARWNEGINLGHQLTSMLTHADNDTSARVFVIAQTVRPTRNLTGNDMPDDVRQAARDGRITTYTFGDVAGWLRAVTQDEASKAPSLVSALLDVEDERLE
jgi:hypothetical protein